LDKNAFRNGLYGRKLLRRPNLSNSEDVEPDEEGEFGHPVVETQHIPPANLFPGFSF